MRNPSLFQGLLAEETERKRKEEATSRHVAELLQQEEDFERRRQREMERTYLARVEFWVDERDLTEIGWSEDSVVVLTIVWCVVESVSLAAALALQEQEQEATNVSVKKWLPHEKATR